MNTIDLKNDFHNLIDKIENKTLLEKFYQMMEYSFNQKKGFLWNNLSEQEQQKLLIVCDESENENTLTSNEDMMLKLKKWL